MVTVSALYWEKNMWDQRYCGYFEIYNPPQIAKMLTTLVVLLNEYMCLSVLTMDYLLSLGTSAPEQMQVKHTPTGSKQWATA